MQKKKSARGGLTSLRSGLVFSMAILFVTAAAVLGYFFVGVVREARVQAEESFSRFAEVSRRQVEETLASSQEAAKLAAYSTSMQRYLLSGVPGVVIDASPAVGDMLNYISVYGSGFTDIVFVSERGRHVSATNAYVELVKEVLAQSAAPDGRFTAPFYSPAFQHGGAAYMLYFFPVYGVIDGYRYRHNPIYFAVLYRLDSFWSEVIGSNYEAGTTALFRGGELIGSSRPLSEAQAEALSAAETGTRTVEVDGRRCLVDAATLSSAAWKLVYLTPEDTLQISFAEQRNFLAAVLLFSALLAVLLIFGILLTVRRDILGITDGIQKTGSGGGHMEMPQLLELRPIQRALNRAVDELHDAAEREQRHAAAEYAAMLSQTRAELLAYRSQINPHFLFNTLETMRSLAHRYGAAPVETLISGLSQMCRYALYSAVTVKLQDELQHLQAYFSVIETRFPGRYRVMERIAPETRAWPVLSMLLQPLAENAVQHAFQGRRGGTLLVQSFQKENRLHVRIADNGVGLSEARLSEIMWAMRHTEEETAALSTEEGMQKISIGLPNIYRRLKLTFGDGAHLLLRSKAGFYTVAELIIPKEKEKL